MAAVNDIDLPDEMLHWNDPKYTYEFSHLPKLLEDIAEAHRRTRGRIKFRALIFCDDTRQTYLPNETRALLLYKGPHLGLTTVLLRDEPVNPRLPGHYVRDTIVHVTLLKNPRNICRKLDLRFGPFDALDQVWNELAKRPESCFLVFSGGRKLQWFHL